MNVQRRALLSRYRTLGIIAFMALVFSILGVALSVKGLTATHAAQQLKDTGVVATVSDVRILVDHRRRKSSGSGSARYRVNGVQVMFTDAQGQSRSDRLNTWVLSGKIPTQDGWTSDFAGHDAFVGKQVLYLPNHSGQAEMRDQVLSTLAAGYDPVNTYVGIGMSVLALLVWGVFLKVAIAQRRGRQPSGIA